MLQVKPGLVLPLSHDIAQVAACFVVPPLALPISPGLQGAWTLWSWTSTMPIAQNRVLQAAQLHLQACQQPIVLLELLHAIGNAMDN